MTEDGSAALAAKAAARAEREARRAAKAQGKARLEARAKAKAEAKRAEELVLLDQVHAAKRDGTLKPISAVKRRKAAEPGHQPVLGMRIVPDPLNPGCKVVATVNLAEHPLEMMLARKRLDQAHYEAGVRYRRIYERAAIGPGRGIDPAKIKVDGGKLIDPLSDEVVQAQMDLARLAREVGMVGERILSAVAGQGTTIADLAQRWPGPDAVRKKMDYLSLRFEEALEVLASQVWGATGPARGRLRGQRDLGSGHVDERAVEVANQSYLRKRGIAL